MARPLGSGLCTQEVIDAVCRNIEEHEMFEAHALEAEGISRKTGEAWKRKAERYPDSIYAEYRRAVERSRARVIARKLSDVSPEFYLTRVDKEQFTERREITGADGGPVSVTIIDPVIAGSEEQEDGESPDGSE